MATKSVLEYERIINARVKELITDQPTWTRPPLAMRETTTAERAAMEGDAPLRALEGVLTPKLMEHFILSALLEPLEDYHHHATKSFSTRPHPKHYEEARHIIRLIEAEKTNWQASLSLDPASLRDHRKRDNLQHLITAIEASTMRPPVNPKGSYANLCRAIVHSVDGLSGCTFTQAFKDRLGIETPETTSVHTRETGVGMEDGGGGTTRVSQVYKKTMNSINPRTGEETHQTTDDKKPGL